MLSRVMNALRTCKNPCDNVQSWPKERLQRCFTRPGLVYAVISCLFFSLSSVLVHNVHEIHAVQTVFFRSSVQLLYTIPMLIRERLNPFRRRSETRLTVLLLFRGLAGSAALCSQFYALQHMPLSDATVLIFTSPIFTGVLACRFLSERWSKLDAASTAFCFLGVVMIAQPGDLFSSGLRSRHHFLSCVAALNGAVLSSVSIVALKKLHRVHFLLSSFYLALTGFLATGTVCLIPGVFCPVVCGHQVHIVFIGLCAVGGQYFLCKSLSSERANTVALVRTFDIVLAFVFQLIFFDHRPNIFSISGAVLISLCNVVILGTARTAETGCSSESHGDTMSKPLIPLASSGCSLESHGGDNMEH